MKRLILIIGLLLSFGTAQAQIAFLDRQSNIDYYSLKCNKLLQQLTYDGGLVGDINWSRDGNRLAFTKHNLIYRINSDGSNLVQLSPSSDVTGITGDISPDWSPDGTKIIYTHMVVPGGDANKRWSVLYTMSAVDGSNQIVILGNAVNVFDQAHYSPDGTQLVFDSDLNDSKNIPNIFKCQTANCSYTLAQLTHLSAAGSPMWSPDGSKIVFEEAQASSGGYGEVATVNSVDGSNLTILTSFTEPSHDPGEPAYSPDGSKIIMSVDDCTNSTIGNGCWGQGDPSVPATIWTMNSDGSNQINTGISCSVAGSPRYSPIH